MIYLIDKSRNYARHLFLCVVSFVFLGSLLSCGNEENRIDPSRQLATDDASLLKWQMEKFVRTRASSYAVSLVTTQTTFKFNNLRFEGSDYMVDWGDGTVESNATSHTYTDGEPAHTIFIISNSSATHLNVKEQGVIYLDVSRSVNLSDLNAGYNRITNIDLSKNQKLKSVNLFENRLHSIDLTYNPLIEELILDNNPIDILDLTMLPRLSYCTAGGTKITSLDIRRNPDLIGLLIGKTEIRDLDVTKNLMLGEIQMNETLIEEIDLSNNARINTFVAYGSKLDNFTLPVGIEELVYLDLRGVPIEQDFSKMMSLSLILKNIPWGIFFTFSPHIKDIQEILKDTQWSVLQQTL